LIYSIEIFKLTVGLKKYNADIELLSRVSIRRLTPGVSISYHKVK
jgi:hypothetical protein